MLELINPTPLPARLFPYTDVQGHTHAVVVLKATFDLRVGVPTLSLSKSQQPIKDAAEFYQTPEDSSIKYDSDLAPRKLATDIVLLGDAVAMNERPVEALETTLALGEHSFTMRVFGDRRWQKSRGEWVMSRPEPFARMPLRYENAYGGYSRAQGDPSLAHPGNPLGKGFFNGVKDRAIEGEALPNIEDPRNLIAGPQDRPQPWCCGAVASGSDARRRLAGSYDKLWERERMPLLPEDFNERFYNSAHTNLQVPLLSGGEQLRITNVSPQGPIECVLPSTEIGASFTIKGKTKRVRANLDTLIIEPNEQRIQTLWRVSVPCYRQFLYLDSVQVIPPRWV